jgi:SAM-dependent methyltransferase
VSQYDDVAEEYEARIVPRFRPIAERLMRVADLRPGDRVLDVAAGTGGLSRLIAQRIGERGCLALVDTSSHMLRVAEQVLEQAAPGSFGRPQIRTIVADLEALPLADGSFDVVAAQMTPLLDNEAGLAEAFRVLAPGGRLNVVAWGGRYEETEILNIARAAVGVGPYPVVRLRAIRGRLARAGFVSIRQGTRPMTVRHASLADYLAYRRGFGTVGFAKETVATYFEALEREVRARKAADEPIRIGWSTTVVTAAKPG